MTSLREDVARATKAITDDQPQLLDHMAEPLVSDRLADAIADAAIAIVLERAAKAVEDHRYGDSFLDSCTTRKEHREHIAACLRAIEGEG